MRLIHRKKNYLITISKDCMDWKCQKKPKDPGCILPDQWFLGADAKAYGNALQEKCDV
jgi:hypothetical protein